MPTIYINGEKHTPSSGTISKMERAGTMPAYSRDPPSGSGGSLGASGSGNRTQQKPVKAPAKTPAKAPAKAPARPAASVPTPRPRPATPAAPAATTKPRWGAPAPKVPARPAGGGVTVVKKNPATNLSQVPGGLGTPINQPFLTGKAPPQRFNQNQSKGVDALRSTLGDYAKKYTSTETKKQMGLMQATGGKVKKFAAGGKVEGNNIIGSKTKHKYRIGQKFQTGAYEYTAMADGSFKRGKRVGATNPKNGDKLIRRATAADLRNLPQGKTAVSTQLSVTRPKKVTSKSNKPPVPVSRKARTGPGGTPTGTYRQAPSRGFSTASTSMPKRQGNKNDNWGIPMSTYGGRLGAPKNPNDNFGIPMSTYKVKPKNKPKNTTSREARDEAASRKKTSTPKRSGNPNDNFGIPMSTYKRK